MTQNSLNWLGWYERFAKYYYLLDGASINYPLFAEKIDVLFKKKGIKKILDFACGTGLPARTTTA